MTIGPDLDDGATKFYDALGEYFAEVLKVVYFENKGWVLTRIDLTNRRYIVEGRQPISYVDIGAGHTALNSLLARMKQDYEGRKKILLFDEIGIMDNENLGRLIEEIKSQVRNHEVILALLSQVDNTVKGVVLEPISCE